MKPSSMQAILSVCVSLAVACGGHSEKSSSNAPPDATPGSGKFVELAIYPGATAKLDVMFVIDNSATMTRLQTQLAADLDAFFDGLDEGAGLPDLHVGVISTDVGKPAPDTTQGDAGELRMVEGVVNDNARYVRTAPSGTGRAQNFTGELSDVVAKMIALGDTGSGFEQPLRALVTAQPKSGSFWRKDARLVLIFLGNEDDCSMADGFELMRNSSVDVFGTLSSFRCTRFGLVCEDGEMTKLGVRQGCKPNDTSAYVMSVAKLIADVRATKVSPDASIYVGTLTGSGAPIEVELALDNALAIKAVCAFNDTVKAMPGTRLQAFAQGFAQHVLGNVCESSYANTLTELADLVDATAYKQCLPAQVTRCEVADASLTPGGVAAPVAACAANNNGAPCWKLVPATECPESGQKLAVERGAQPLAADTYTTARCERATM